MEMYPIIRTHFYARFLPQQGALELMTFFTRVWDADTPFIHLKMEDTKYHCSHFKLIGFPPSRTFLNTIHSPSLKTSQSSFLNPVP